MKRLAKWLVATSVSAGGIALAVIPIVRIPGPASPRVATANATETARGRENQHRVAVAPRSTSAADRRRDLVRDIEAALVSVDDRERERALGESLPQLMAIDPSVAAAILERTPRGPGRDELRDRIARRWAAADLDDALEWVTTLEDDDDRRLAITEIRSQIAASDPGTAIEISDLMDVGRSDGTLAHIVQMWAENDLSAAKAWAENQPAGPLRDELVERIALVEARRSR
jgi:hypothetical protein